MLEKIDPERAKMLLHLAQTTVDQRYDFYNQLAGLKPQYTHPTG
jgi:hypothetical protein